jgi:GPH family glycoside/pentoside/hexuronide:cation symporter
MLYLVNIFLVFFLVRHVGMAAATAGALMMITRVFDAVIDPLLGNASDRSDTRWGRRRPWMLAGTVFCPIACLALFNPPVSLDGIWLSGYVLTMLIAYYLGYSLFSVPHMALGTEMTDDYGERAALMAHRTFFIYCSTFFIVAGAPALIAALGSDRQAYGQMAWAAGILIAVTLLIATIGTSGAKLTRPSSHQLQFRQWARSIAANRPFFIILVAKMMLQLGTGFKGAAGLFFMIFILGKDESIFAVYGLGSSVAALVSVPLWSRALQHIERRPLLVTTLIIYGIASVSWLLAGPEESMVIFVLRSLVVGASSCGSILIALAMLTDTIEYDRLCSGQRREGVYVGAFEFMQTTAFALGPLLAGFAFSAAGFLAGEGDAALQPPAALLMIKLAMAIAPAICCAIAILMLAAYRLDQASLADARAASA